MVNFALQVNSQLKNVEKSQQSLLCIAYGLWLIAYGLWLMQRSVQFLYINHKVQNHEI